MRFFPEYLTCWKRLWISKEMPVALLCARDREPSDVTKPIIYPNSGVVAGISGCPRVYSHGLSSHALRLRLGRNARNPAFCGAFAWRVNVRPPKHTRRETDCPDHVLQSRSRRTNMKSARNGEIIHSWEIQFILRLLELASRLVHSVSVGFSKVTSSPSPQRSRMALNRQR